MERLRSSFPLMDFVRCLRLVVEHADVLETVQPGRELDRSLEIFFYGHKLVLFPGHLRYVCREARPVGPVQVRRHFDGGVSGAIRLNPSQTVSVKHAPSPKVIVLRPQEMSCVVIPQEAGEVD